jgi:hypothetical protein
MTSYGDQLDHGIWNLWNMHNIEHYIVGHVKIQQNLEDP